MPGGALSVLLAMVPSLHDKKADYFPSVSVQSGAKQVFVFCYIVLLSVIVWKRCVTRTNTTIQEAIQRFYYPPIGG
jgi:hypothetical protein